MCSMLAARDPSFRAADERKMATKNAPRTVKDVPAQEFVIALAQYFRSTGKVREESNARDARASRRDRATTRARERRGDGRSNATTSAMKNANVFVRIDRRRARRRAGVRASTTARDVGVESSARASPRASGAGAVRATARVPSCDVDGRCARSHLCDRVRVRRRACATSRDAGDRDVAIDRRWLRGQPSRARARRGRGESAIVI